MRNLEAEFILGIQTTGLLIKNWVVEVKLKKNGNYERKRKRLTLCFCFVLGTENDEFKKLNVRSSAESPILIPKSPRTMAGS